MTTIIEYRSTYFYNIQKNEKNIVDHFNIWFKNNTDIDHLYDIINDFFDEYIQCNNLKEFIDFISYEEKENNITIINYKSSNIINNIFIKKIDENNYNIKIELIDLLDNQTKKSINSDEYLNMLKNIENLKSDLIISNKYLNNYLENEQNNYRNLIN